MGLNKKDYLKRRLQTIVFKKGLASTIKAARQLIVHKKVLVDNKVVNVPSYIVPVALEGKIKLKEKKKNIKKEEKPKEETKTEVKEE